MTRRGRASAWSFCAALALVVGACGGATMPAALRDELARGPRGTVTVVFFTDFQCPFCRRTHAALEAAIAARHEPVRVVLEHVPLPSHPDARTAARAAICAQAQSIDLSRALFEAESLSAASCEAVAVGAGADRARFRACVAAPSTDERIDRDTQLFDSIDGDGVPVLFVGRARLEGEQSEASLARAIAAARE